MSPEQTGRTGRSVDSRTDLYSLGASFYEMLTGRPPFTEQDAIELVHAHLARRITDSGAGLSPQLLPRVFDLFVQSDRTIDRAQGGLGMGLAIVKRLVQMHGGEVSAHSDGEGRGSTFAIRLPRIQRPAEAAAVSAPSNSRQQRVLIVDDNTDAASSLALLLTLQGHETEVAFCGKEALGCLTSFKPDFVLLDLGLPEMDGYEVAARIRAMPEFRQLRIVALSGYGQPEDRQRTQAAGFDDHLVKPIDMTALDQALSASN